MTSIKKARYVFDFWIVICSFVSSSFFGSGFVPKYFNLQGIWYVLANLVSSAVLLFLLIIFPLLLLKLTGIHRFFLPQSRVEGWWLQKVSIADRPWSLSTIKKNYFFGWTYEGYAYGEDGSVRAAWISRDIAFDEENQYWIFKGKSVRYDVNEHPLGEGHVLSVIYWGTYLTKLKTDKHALLPGRIADLDYDDQPTAATITLVPVVRKDWDAADIARPNGWLPAHQIKSLIQRIQTKTGKNL